MSKWNILQILSKNQKISREKVIISVLGLLLPFVLLILFAWYLGFFVEKKNIVNICRKVSNNNDCNNTFGCDWNKEQNVCDMTKACTNIKSQQECGAGCTWDPNSKQSNSNLYGVCFPDFKLDINDVGGPTELAS